MKNKTTNRLERDKPNLMLKEILPTDGKTMGMLNIETGKKIFLNKGGEMEKRKFLILARYVLMAVLVFLSGHKQVFAAQSSSISEQLPQNHDKQAILDKLNRRLTPEQRAKAAARLKAKRIAANPAIRTRLRAAREAQAAEVKARVEALNDKTVSTVSAPVQTNSKKTNAKITRKITTVTINPATAQRLKTARAQAAAARQAVAKGTNNNIGGINE